MRSSYDFSQAARSKYAARLTRASGANLPPRRRTSAPWNSTRGASTACWAPLARLARSATILRRAPSISSFSSLLIVGGDGLH